MNGPSWLTGSLAAVMILTAVYSASRLAVSRLRRRTTEFDADALHAVMGAAMAGMLVPRLNVLPGSVWLVIFGMGAAWFGWHAVRAQGLRVSGHSPGRFPVPHLIECVAMVYMLLPLHGAPPTHGGTGMAMAGMGASAGAPRVRSRHSRPSWPCSWSATSCGPPTGWHPWRGPRPPRRWRRRRSLPMVRVAPSAPRRRRIPAREPAWPAGARPHARHMRQARDEHHHGLHAHPHALAMGYADVAGSASGRDVGAITGSGAAGASGGGAGSSSSNSEPWPSVLRTRTEPWWASAMACTMARPSPNPPASRLPRRVGPGEPLEDPVQVGRCDAGAGVRDRSG